MESTLNLWQKKLDYLEAQGAIIADPAHKFQLDEQIRECQQKIRELANTSSFDKIIPEEIKVLFISFFGINKLPLNQFIRELRGGLTRASRESRYTLETAEINEIRELRRTILRFKPNIIHFINDGNNELATKDESGVIKAISADSLIQLFYLCKDSVKCVVLQGGYADPQAVAIASQIAYVFGISSGEHEQAALEFCIAFYDAIESGKDYQYAFEYASNAIAQISPDFSPSVFQKRDFSSSYTTIREYKDDLTTYEQEYLKTIQNHSSLNQTLHSELKQLQSYLGLKDEDIEYVESRAEDIQKINLAIQSGNFSHPHQLAQSIIRRIKALDYKEINTTLSDASLWEITLPTTGLKLSSQKALFCLTCSENSLIFQKLDEQIQKSNYTFLILVAKNKCCEQDLRQLQTIWLDYPTLQTLIETPEEKVVTWLTSTLFRQTNSAALSGMLPYKTKGSAGDSFFGRDSELARIVNGYQKGGILIGAHRSGKTSFLNKLQEKLSRSGSEVIGPKSFFSLNEFFEETLTPLKIPLSDNLEKWASLLKEYSRKNSGERLVFLLDEVDGLITVDAEIDFKLSQQMRRLQNEGYCEFFLAGHNKLREAITTEYSPLRNFAEEMILLGLTKEAAKDLIQQPMKSLGFEVTDAYVNRIYTGTAGVAALIQEFCVKLLNELNQNGASEITQNDIEKVEQMPEFLNNVKEYYQYAQDWQYLSITILTAINREISRDDIRNKFSEYGISYTKQKLDDVLQFLTQFGVLKEYKSGHFRILAKYLRDAIEANEPQLRLKEQLEKGKS